MGREMGECGGRRRELALDSRIRPPRSPSLFISLARAPSLHPSSSSSLDTPAAVPIVVVSRCVRRLSPRSSAFVRDEGCIISDDSIWRLPRPGEGGKELGQTVRICFLPRASLSGLVDVIRMLGGGSRFGQFVRVLSHPHQAEADIIYTLLGRNVGIRSD
ncbi:hypothetical protein ACLOJK_038055 [Asimina triloba]